MNNIKYTCGLLIGLLVAGCASKVDIKPVIAEKSVVSAPSVKKGDPPPGNAKNLTIP